MKIITRESAAPMNCPQCSLPIEWHDCEWCPVIVRRRAGQSRRSAPAGSANSFSRRVSANTCSHYHQTMNLSSRFSRRPAAFTLIELLTVIAIIAVLAAMLLPVINIAVQKARVARAKTEEAGLVNAIEAYDSAYGRMPVSTNAQMQAIANANLGGNPDFTYGGTFTSSSGNSSVGTYVGGGAPYSNAEVIAILMDMTAYPNGLPTCNANHVKNPKQTIFLNAHLATATGQGIPGVDSAGVYRDPWSNPYMITMDLNYDNMCQDTLYSQFAVSGTGAANGLNGLFNPQTPPTSDNFLYRGKVMVWSFGPDGKYGTNAASDGYNQDNVLSWK